MTRVPSGQLDFPPQDAGMTFTPPDRHGSSAYARHSGHGTS